jgi:hypothetical protein
MKNGSRLIGELIRIEADKVTFSTPFADTITANQDKVERIITQAAVTLLPKINLCEHHNHESIQATAPHCSARHSLLRRYQLDVTISQSRRFSY